MLTNEQIDTMPAGREMDAQIHIHVFNGDASDCYDADGQMLESWDAAYLREGEQYSTDIAAAFQVAESVDLFDRLSLGRDSRGQWVMMEVEPVTYIATGATPALAICRAALKVTCATRQ